MKKRKTKQDERIYQIKVILSDWYGRVRGRPYRVLAVPEGFSLYSLAEAIVEAFDFDFDHAFGFFDNIKNWTNSVECYDLFSDMEEDFVEPTNCRSVKKTKVKEVFSEIKNRMLFLFDYGDEWHFIVEFKGIEPSKKDVEYPLIVKSVGEAPPQYEGIEEE
jgi:hypothetical protein